MAYAIGILVQIPFESLLAYQTCTSTPCDLVHATKRLLVAGAVTRLPAARSTSRRRPPDALR
jgi:hypothetical protein